MKKIPPLVSKEVPTIEEILNSEIGLSIELISFIKQRSKKLVSSRRREIYENCIDIIDGVRFPIEEGLLIGGVLFQLKLALETILNEKDLPIEKE